MMIKDLFHKIRKPVGELITETTMELGKCYSRLELASSKLDRRNENLFEACSFHVRKGSKARATIYANEIAEIRKVLSVLQHTQLAVERAILRLDTLKVMSPTLESIEEAFSDVKNALGLVATVMPSITPEISQLTNVVNEILEGTQFNLDMPAPIVTTDPTAEAILQEAASIVEQEFKTRMPEPPVSVEVSKPMIPVKPMIALAADGSEVIVGSDQGQAVEKGSVDTFDVSLFLLEELVMDYIERNRGDMNLTRCAKELNLPQSKILEALNILSKKGRIEIQQ
jgi:division protein CdvB (Snf7/Vps24/ESCRT-III family)